ncbi:response regulator [Millisia brevis]|uniref:response regulator n=1 Tax=Millisia brevis TaxID=264148 RepID=UPI000834F6BD|nr:response regulator [Millisia brevis]
MIRVLVVEDEPIIARSHHTYLDRLDGFEVVATAGTARAAVLAARNAAREESPIDLVLLDIGLPDASGIDIVSTLAAIDPPPDVIAVTSQRDLDTVRTAVAHGVLLYLLKPFTFAAFREKLEQYVRYREAMSTGSDAVSQGDIDRAFAQLRSVAPRSTARKGTAPETADAVARAIRDADAGLTASETAHVVGSSRVTAWRYLEALADDGIVARSTEYGRTGRPQVRYRWTSRDG